MNANTMVVRCDALIKKAKERHGKDAPLFSKGFTMHDDDNLLFWYDDIDGSTHVVPEKELVVAS